MGTISEIIPITGFMLHGNAATIPYRWLCVALSLRICCAYGSPACPTKPSKAPEIVNEKCQSCMGKQSEGFGKGPKILTFQAEMTATDEPYELPPHRARQVRDPAVRFVEGRACHVRDGGGGCGRATIT